MKRLLKWMGYLLAGSIVILLALVLLLNAYKAEILTAINQNLKEKINGDVHIGDIRVTVLHNFPHISIILDDVYLQGPEYNRFQRPFLKAERIDINIKAMRLLNKEISIRSIDVEHGDVFVFKTRDGFTNSEILRKDPSPQRPSSGQLKVTGSKIVNLEDVHIVYHDSLKHKSFGVHFIRTENSISGKGHVTSIEINGNMTFDGLMLNASKGQFLKGKNTLASINLEIDSTGKNVAVLPSKLIFDNSSLLVSGKFLFSEPARFQLDIVSEKLDYTEGLTILPDTLAKKLGKYNVEKPIDIKVNIEGVLEPGIKPAVNVAFSFADSKVSAGKVVMEKTTIDGTFINHLNPDLPNDANNSRLQFAHLKGLINDLPVEATVTLSDMRDPFLELQAVFSVDLKDLNDNFDTTKLKLTTGHFVSTFFYSGKLREYLDDTRTTYEGKLAGEAKITNGGLEYLSSKVHLNNIEGTFGFTEKQFDVRKLMLTLNKNEIEMHGTMSDFIPFFVNPKNTGKLRLAINSPKLDITGLLQPRNRHATRKAKAASKKKVAYMVDRLNDELEFDIDFNIKEFSNNNFKASSLKGKMSLAKNVFLIKNAGMNFAGGKVAMNMRVSNLQRKVNPLLITAKLDHVALKQFFYCFNDFNQSTFRHQHVDGKLSLDLEMTAEINDKLEFLMPNLRGTAKFTIEDGRLTDFEPMQRLSNFLLKGRDFSDVQFGEIKSQIAMRGTKMDVSRMEIESTVLTMFIEGRYDIGDSSDLSIQVPLSNLKKRDQDIAPEN
ncbi:MAG TPA: AsmA family protein, partial [Chryseolinea sp.]|nr:AsmA family protein [Chryseolinea sp.]